MTTWLKNTLILFKADATPKSIKKLTFKPDGGEETFKEKWKWTKNDHFYIKYLKKKVNKLYLIT